MTSAATPETLVATWESIGRPSFDTLQGRRVSEVDPAVYAALDARGRRWLLVEVSPTVSAFAERASSALEVAVGEFDIGSHRNGRFMALICCQAEHERTFAALSTDILTALSTVVEDPVHSVRAVIRRWRAFFSLSAIGLSAEQALGLFGELWFMSSWLPVCRHSVEAWTGPDSSRHDFQYPSMSVEVKVTALQGGPVHRISTLEQLEAPATGQLFLFSLHVADDALAANTLAGLVGSIRASLLPDTLDEFDLRLARAGYNPVDASQYRRPLRILSERIYHVTDAYPRLTRASFPGGVPPGVGGITYTLSMHACGPWLVADSPAAGGWLELRAQYGL